MKKIKYCTKPVAKVSECRNCHIITIEYCTKPVAKVSVCRNCHIITDVHEFELSTHDTIDLCDDCLLDYIEEGPWPEHEGPFGAER